MTQKKRTIKKIQITTVDSKKVKMFFVNRQHTVLLFSHMTQCYRKSMILQYNATNVSNHNVEIEKLVRKF